jgi:hypothetical protein
MKTTVSVVPEMIAELIVGEPGVPSEISIGEDARLFPISLLALKIMESPTVPEKLFTVPLPVIPINGKVETCNESQLTPSSILYEYRVIGEDPWLDGARKLIVNVVVPDKIAEVILGAPGVPSEIGNGGDDGRPFPTWLVALKIIELPTVPEKLFTVPLPDIPIDGKVETCKESQFTPSSILYEYRVIGEEPWLLGAKKLIVNVLLTDRIAELIVGEPGVPSDIVVGNDA